MARDEAHVQQGFSGILAVEKQRMKVDNSAQINWRRFDFHEKFSAAVQAALYAVAPKRTETSLETPGSCMVTPYRTGAMLIVFLL